MVGDILRYAMRMLLLAAGILVVAVKGLPLLQPDAQPADAPAAIPATAVYGTAVTLDGNGAGHFEANVRVNGATLRMLVDTGATAVALSAEDAERAAIHPFPGDFTVPIATANGTLMAARAEIADMSLGQIRMRDVTALVLPPGATRVSLLGMTFLRRLSSFQVTENRLILKP
jgi:aspartyl protease family protein